MCSTCALKHYSSFNTQTSPVARLKIPETNMLKKLQKCTKKFMRLCDYVNAPISQIHSCHHKALKIYMWPKNSATYILSYYISKHIYYHIILVNIIHRDGPNIYYTPYVHTLSNVRITLLKPVHHLTIHIS